MNMQNNDKVLYKTTLALAGIVQSIILVNELAKTGKLNETAYESSIYSIFQITPNDVSSVYNDKKNLWLGLNGLIKICGKRTAETHSPIRYVLSLIHLQKKIWGKEASLKQLTTRINQISKQVEYFHLTHSTIISNLADTYLTAIAPFKFRIVILGTQRSLGVTENMNKIRALLLAGIRSVVLWRQLGGSRWQLLFCRAQIRSMAEKILTEIDPPVASPHLNDS